MHGDIPTTRRFVTPAIQRDTYTAIPDKSRYPPRQDARRQQHADIGTEQTGDTERQTHGYGQIRHYVQEMETGYEAV